MVVNYGTDRNPTITAEQIEVTMASRKTFERGEIIEFVPDSAAYPGRRVPAHAWKSARYIGPVHDRRGWHRIRVGADRHPTLVPSRRLRAIEMRLNTDGKL